MDSVPTDNAGSLYKLSITKKGILKMKTEKVRRWCARNANTIILPIGSMLSTYAPTRSPTIISILIIFALCLLYKKYIHNN